MESIALLLGIVFGTAALPPTSQCMQNATDVGEAVYIDFETGTLHPLSDEEREQIIQTARNECWYNKGDRKS